MTSRLQKMTRNKLNFYFGHLDIRENSRPPWLTSEKGTRLELDFYAPSASVAIEVQGVQHTEYTPFFHRDYKDYEYQKQRDKRKKQVCKKRGITLYEIFTEEDIDNTVCFIDTLLKEIEEYRPPDCYEYILPVDYETTIHKLVKTEKENNLSAFPDWTPTIEDRFQRQKKKKKSREKIKEEFISKWVSRRVYTIVQACNSGETKLDARALRAGMSLIQALEYGEIDRSRIEKYFYRKIERFPPPNGTIAALNRFNRYLIESRDIWYKQLMEKYKIKIAI